MKMNPMKYDQLIYRIMALGLAIICSGELQAQDPLFSQFYASPMNVSPALTGAGKADWRISANVRNQSVGDQFISLNTTALSFDGKIFKQPYRASNYVGLGLMILQDAGLGGAFKNNTIQLSVSSHVSLDEEDNHGICAGLGVSYNNTLINFNDLTFSPQLSFAGFNRALPTQEMSLNSVKPYYSVSGGVTYTFTSDKANFDLGVSGYRFNRNNRTALNDGTQIEAPRYNVHSDFQTFINDRLAVNLNAVFVFQNQADTYLVGANFGRLMSNDDLPTVINAGLWYRQNTAIIPYLGIMYKNMQAGLTYDIYVGNSSSGAIRTFELSLILRKPGKTGRLMDSFGK
jgi:type IX secretion system PorP/SprF family membrane protein